MFKESLKEALWRNDKRAAFALCETFLRERPTHILTLYQDIFPTLLNSIHCADGDMACVFQEHQISAIVRALVEGLFPWVYDAREVLENPPHVLLACVQDETHEIGALIGEQLFVYHGFKTTYLGANTPLESLLNALTQLSDVTLVVLSATNAYNLTRLKTTVQSLKTLHPTLKLYGAGRAVRKHASQLALDGLIESSDDIKALLKERG